MITPRMRLRITLRSAAKDIQDSGEAPDPNRIRNFFGLQGFPASCISLAFVSKALSSAAFRGVILFFG
ncbi:MAG: hypothetical protein A3E80_06320 [Chlamydiae bacterium RIFCSPHIGHO2_12_FULL_49_9]|nr:MAG: hypothetical protein A3E80_06320 [Chlamydiae bacterium RIFCSPHIGHO2_12_FULL_49_9]